jgi:hypothetical protein
MNTVDVVSAIQSDHGIPVIIDMVREPFLKASTEVKE